jgi:hypothetical protein
VVGVRVDPVGAFAITADAVKMTPIVNQKRIVSGYAAFFAVMGLAGLRPLVHPLMSDVVRRWQARHRIVTTTLPLARPASM